MLMNIPLDYFALALAAGRIHYRRVSSGAKASSCPRLPREMSRDFTGAS